MNARFTHDLRDENVTRKGWVNFFPLRTAFFTFSLSLNFFEDIKGQALIFLKAAVNKEFLAFSGVAEIEDLRRFVINVGLIVITLLNRLLWGNKFADVDSRCTGEILKMVDKVLKLLG